MPLSKETKALIEQQAIKFAEENEDVITNIHSYRTGNDLWKGYEAGATPYAEKWEAAEKEIEFLKDTLHIDQTGLAAGLAQVNKIANGYRWVTEGRGPYEWDDNKYKEEMGNMLDNISEAAIKALNNSGAIAHSVCCKKEGRTVTMEGIGYVKATLLEAAEQENKRLREALGKILSINAAPNRDALIDKLKSVAKEALKPNNP